MKKYFFILSLLLFSYHNFFAQQSKKSVTALRVTSAPTIDGVLDEPFWENIETAKDFVMFKPGDGTAERTNKKTIVKIAYDDEAIYFGAILYDDETEKIPLQFTSRDEFGNTDYFSISINPLNNGQDDARFIVMSTGAQADLKANGGREDSSWNAVWSSAVKINKDNWVVEIKIPYSQLRFNNSEIQTWGINFLRKINYLDEEYTWNYIDRSTGIASQYNGELNGLKNIKPPTRLIFYPYASGAFSSYDGENEFQQSFGLDIKYGLSESYTLDVTLIPDFGQTAFDEAVLNLGPFEQRYSEKRAFFTEGTELFEKGRLFYSRRIGDTPVDYYDVYDNLGENEDVVDNPTKVNMINAIKLSGRDKNGLGIGIFNAVTEKTSATIKDTITGEVRKEVTEPLANYNVFVIDQQFNNNSSVSFVNTNVLREGGFRDANASAFLYDINDKKNKFNVRGDMKMSYIREDGESTSGYAGSIRFSKIYGNIQFAVMHFRSDSNYDINDLGFQRKNNYAIYDGRLSYQIFEPTNTFNKYKINFSFGFDYLNSPNLPIKKDIELSAFFSTINRFTFGGNIQTSVDDVYDYYEPRVDDRVFIQNGTLETGAWISTDFRKKFATELRLEYEKRYDDDNELISIGFEPRYRFTDKFQLIYSLDFGNVNNEKGYVDELDDGTIIFGNRDVKQITNALSGKYNFNTMSSVSISFRHYWSPVKYDDNYYELNEDGTLDPSNYTENNDINYNIWNLDLNYTWEFAPGSFLVALYRNSIFNEDDLSSLNFGQNLDRLFKEPINNEVSVKFIYYLDLNKIKSWL